MKFVGSVKLQNPRTGQIRTKNFEADICDSGAQKYGNGKEPAIHRLQRRRVRGGLSA